MQDSFDIGFVKVLGVLESEGYLRNESQLQRELNLSLGRLYEIKNGYRHVPKKHRDGILKYMMDRYDVNPNVFVHADESVFNNNPPRMREDAAIYDVKKIVATAGDMVYIHKLERDNKHLLEENLLLRKLVSSLESQLAKYSNK